MDKNESLNRAINEKVVIAPYDESWPAMFEKERYELLNMFRESLVAVEHFGSTAVAGLSAKPIIDIMAGVVSMAQADELLEPLCRVGYTTSDEFNASLVDRRWLMRHSNGRRTHHLHLMVYKSEAWIRHLEFRDKLRASKQLAREYESKKKKWASEYVFDREEYTNSKSIFIENTLTI